MANQYQTIESAFVEWRDNPSNAAMDTLIQACQGLVFHYAKLYGGGYSFEDLCQSGYEGLLKGIQNFNSDIGTKFVTYASHCIIGEIRHYVRRESRYYYPGYLESYRERMDKIILDSLDAKEEPISADELAIKLNLQPNAILPVMSAGLVHLGHMELSSIKAKEMESFTLPIEDKLLISKLMYRLTAIQKDVIELLFQKGMTQEEVAKELGLTQKQVSRIKQKSLDKMKNGIKK
ncbi:MAG: RNA polymerase subunit sigma [Firmicutes bacterium HGW-Firmicutes-11]|nr:MAG: RNA polymerase subunit sigma [Firmicutes bacterium HGW-Firmicutes-11]